MICAQGGHMMVAKASRAGRDAQAQRCEEARGQMRAHIPGEAPACTSDMHMS